MNILKVLFTLFIVYAVYSYSKHYSLIEFSIKFSYTFNPIEISFRLNSVRSFEVLHEVFSIIRSSYQSDDLVLTHCHFSCFINKVFFTHPKNVVPTVDDPQKYTHKTTTLYILHHLQTL